MSRKENIEVDEFATLRNLFESTIKEQRLYFDLLASTNEGKPYIDAVSKNVLKMSMHDQITILKCIDMTNKYAKQFCEKYGFEVEEEI